MTLTFVTSSADKYREVQAILGLPLERVDLDLPEWQGLDVLFLAQGKAKEAFSRLGRPVLVEDTSLELTALGGFPGPLVKWLLKAAGAHALPKILEGFSDKTALAKTAAVAFDGKDLVSALGVVRGTIVHEPRGRHGFGWDVVFAPDQAGGKTYAELSLEEKNRFSHRAQALRSLRQALEDHRWTTS